MDRRWVLLLVALSGCAGGTASGRAPTSPVGAASPGTTPTAPTAALDGSCSCEHVDPAANEAESQERHVFVEIHAGRVSAARDVLSSNAGGVDTATFAGAGPEVVTGRQVEVTVTLEGSAAKHPLRFTVSGDTITLDDGTAGKCEWHQNADAGPGAGAASSAAPAAASAPAPTVEHPDNTGGRTVVRVGKLAVDCETNLTPQAALNRCRLSGSAGEAQIGWGRSDDGGALMCSRASVEYQFQHGGGWDTGENVMTKIGPEGARAHLADGVDAWFSPHLDHVELDAPGGSVVLDLDIDAMSVTARPGQHVANAAAKQIVDLAAPHAQSFGCDAK